MLSQPVLQSRKLDGPWLGQGARSEPADPVVGHVQGFSYLSMLSDGLFNRFPSLFYAFFDIHVLTL